MFWMLRILLGRAHYRRRWSRLAEVAMADADRATAELDRRVRHGDVRRRAGGDTRRVASLATTGRRREESPAAATPIPAPRVSRPVA
jgi:hypothetical protein